VPAVRLNGIEPAQCAAVALLERENAPVRILGQFELAGTARGVGLRQQALHGRLALRLEIQSERHVVRICARRLREFGDAFFEAPRADRVHSPRRCSCTPAQPASAQAISTAIQSRCRFTANLRLAAAGARFSGL